MIRVRIHLDHYQDSGLRNARRIFEKEITNTFSALGSHLAKSAKKRMRRDTGEAQKGLVPQISGSGIDLKLTVVTPYIQAVVDAYGVKPRRAFPPWQRGSRIYAWAYRHSRSWDTEEAVRNVPKVRGITKLTRVTGGRFKRGNVPLAPVTRRANRDRKLDRIAFLVARSVFRKGIPPSFWHRVTLDSNRRKIVRDTQLAFNRAAKIITRGGK